MKYVRKAGLRARFGWSIAVPLLALMSIFSYWQYAREIQFIQAENESDAQTVGNVMLMGLRHAMLLNDQSLVRGMIQNSTGSKNVERVMLLDHDGFVKADSAATGAQAGVMLNPRSTSGCRECHQGPDGNLPRTLNIQIGDVDTVRVATPVENSPECNQCHGSGTRYLGILLVDVSAQSDQEMARKNALTTLGLSIAATLLIFLGIYFLLDFVIIRRIRSFLKPLSAYADGNYNARLAVSNAGDELDTLAATFNGMISQIERHIEEERKRGELLSNTIVEERERIARELHDSLPQLLAYLNTKIGAIYLFVEGGKKKEALANLRELENASRNLLTDVRDAIHGLRASRLLASGLTLAIRNYLDQFRELCKIPVEFSSNLESEKIQISPEIEVQALRIVQEALSNIRKHSRASQASVQTMIREQQLELVISDNGAGFDPALHASPGKSEYGLQTMRERAESLGGRFVLQSQAGKGTTINVSLPLSIGKTA